MTRKDGWMEVDGQPVGIAPVIIEAILEQFGPEWADENDYVLLSEAESVLSDRRG